jgi:beta-phosphoglucomutase-like phosphatase (HAD superfamily)
VAELVIFDCDGVLVDSDRISLRIQAERISALGFAAVTPAARLGDADTLFTAMEDLPELISSHA